MPSSNSIKPDFDFEVHPKGHKIALKGEPGDGFTFIHMFRMQQEYLSATKMDEARLEVHKIRGLFYAKPLKQAISEAMEIIRRAHEYEAKVRWQMTGQISLSLAVSRTLTKCWGD